MIKQILLVLLCYLHFIIAFGQDGTLLKTKDMEVFLPKKLISDKIIVQKANLKIRSVLAGDNGSTFWVKISEIKDYLDESSLKIQKDPNIENIMLDTYIYNTHKELYNKDSKLLSYKTFISNHHQIRDYLWQISFNNEIMIIAVWYAVSPPDKIFVFQHTYKKLNGNKESLKKESNTFFNSILLK